MVILDIAIVNVALPSIQTSLGFSAPDLQWVVNAYTITFAGFLMLSGRAADLFGHRRTFVSGLLLFSLASLIGGTATDSQVAPYADNYFEYDSQRRVTKEIADCVYTALLCSPPHLPARPLKSGGRYRVARAMFS